jgi:hypothetical protein
VAVLRITATEIRRISPGVVSVRATTFETSYVTVSDSRLPSLLVELVEAAVAARAAARFGVAGLPGVAGSAAGGGGGVGIDTGFEE